MNYKLIKCGQKEEDSCIRFKVKTKQMGVKINIYISTNGDFMITYRKRKIGLFSYSCVESLIINDFLSDLKDFPEEVQKRLLQEARRRS